MLENIKNGIKKGYDQQMQKQQIYAANPNTKEAKKYNRTMGIVGLALGGIAIITVIASYLITGKVLIISLACAIAFPIIGAWMLITGKKINK